MGIEGVGVEVDAVREMVDEVLYQPHVIPGIIRLKPDPVSGKDVVEGEIYAQQEGDSADESQCQSV